MELPNGRRISVSISRRHDPSPVIRYGIPVFAIVASLLFAGLAISAIGVDPMAAYGTMVTSVLSFYGLSEVIVRMIPLLLAGLAVYVPMRAGLWNIGAGAGIYTGGMVATAVGLSLDLPGPILVVVMLLAAGLGSGLLMLVPGYLRARWDINEILVTLLLTFTMIQLNGYAILLMGSEQGVQSSKTLPAAAQFPRFLGTRIHLGAVVGVLALLAVYLMMNRTRFGFEILNFGSNPEAATQSGISKYRIVIGTLFIGGMLSGLAGAGEVAGIQRRLVPNFSPGFGFTAIAIALVGQNGAFRVFLASLFFAVVYIGAANIELLYPVPFAIVDIIEAVVILFFIAGEGIRRFEIHLNVSPQSEENSEVVKA
jgi:simple sugar transport system permease protein